MIVVCTFTICILSFHVQACSSLMTTRSFSITRRTIIKHQKSFYWAK